MKNPTRNLVMGLAAALALSALAGCSTLSVIYDYDNNVAWEAYDTYGWLGGNELPPEDRAGTGLGGGLLDNRIQEAVNREMNARGISLADSPGLLVKYHLGTEEKVQVTDWGYRYSDYYWGYGGRQIDVYEFTEGTLVIDIIDAGTKTLVWRGSATGTLDGQQRSPEERQERVDTVVNRILEHFPPQ